MHLRIALLTIAAAYALAAGTAVGRSALAADANASPAASASPIVVEIKNFAFAPAALTVPLGASVTFTNRDAASHTATAGDRSWDTGNLDQGQSKTVTFAKAGTFTYVCIYHPNMVGSLTVGKPSQSPSSIPAPAATFNSGY